MHEAYFARFSGWVEQRRAAGLPITEHPDPHAPGLMALFRRDHNTNCTLLYGARSIVKELGGPLAIWTGGYGESIIKRINVTCAETSQLICETQHRPGRDQRRQIRFSHGFHFFLLNTSLIVTPFMREETTGVRSDLPVERAQALFKQQLSYFWTQTPNEALLFPYWEFSPSDHVRAAEMTFLMISFLLAHEMAHHFIPRTPNTFPEFEDTEKEARRFLDMIPPPFLGMPPDPQWKDHWTEELLCDVLAIMTVYACSSRDGPAPNAPGIHAYTQETRYLAMAATLLHIEALYWGSALDGKKLAALITQFSPTHPLPNLRRVFLNGWVAGFDRTHARLPEVYERALRRVAALPPRGIQLQ